MQCQGPLPTGGPVGGKAVHSLRDALGCDADACLDQPEGKGFHILPQAVLSGREDQAVPGTEASASSAAFAGEQSGSAGSALPT